MVAVLINTFYIGCTLTTTRLFTTRAVTTTTWRMWRVRAAPVLWRCYWGPPVAAAVTTWGTLATLAVTTTSVA